MDMGAFVSAISTVGFPIATSIALGWAAYRASMQLVAGHLAALDEVTLCMREVREDIRQIRQSLAITGLTGNRPGQP